MPLYESVFNSIIRNKLNGSRITLIEMGSEDDYSDIIDLLKVAGASIGPSLAFDASLFRKNMNWIILSMFHLKQY